MDFFEAVEKRKSIRKFQEREIENSKLEKIIDACNKSPSAGNLQAYRIFVVKDKEKKQALVKTANGQEFIEEAPVVLVFCANPKESGVRYGERGENLYSVQDATIAAAYSQIASASLGLGSVWVGAFSDRDVRTVLGTELKPVAVIPIGYPDEEPETTPRKNTEEIVK
jgi:nitroreductase